MKVNIFDQIKPIKKDYDQFTYITPRACIHYSYISDIPLWELDSNNREGRYSRIFENIKRVAGMHSDNHILSITNINGYSFSFMVHLSHDKKCWDIQMWDETGSLSILQEHVLVRTAKIDTIPADVLRRFMKASQKFKKGLLPCSKCGMQMNLHTNENYGGMFYAGRYCNKCWEGGMKQQEAAENYD